MESVAEVPEEASGLDQPRFWIRVFLLLDRLPAKANEPCLPHHTHTHTQPFYGCMDFVLQYNTIQYSFNRKLAERNLTIKCIVSYTE